MSYQSFIKSEHRDVPLRQLLDQSPLVLLGVSVAATDALRTLRIGTVFDLAMSTLFDNASRIVAGSSEMTSDFRKFGRPPASIVDADLVDSIAVTSLPHEPIEALIGIGPQNGPDIREAFGVERVRDLALWPPYLAAKLMVKGAYDPEPASDADPEAPAELLPKSGDFGTERYFYPALVMEPADYADDGTLLNATSFDVTASPSSGFETVRFGALLTYSHTWTPKQVAKGQLLHSVPLAPGESTSVAVIDWTNKSAAATRQTLSESERIASVNDRSRAITQITDAVASECQSGHSTSRSVSDSSSSAMTGFLGLSSVSLSSSTSGTIAGTYTVSSGTRSVDAHLQQNIADATQQFSSAARNQRAAVITEVSQQEREYLATRSLTNYNHAHALTINYYEIVQVYETEVALSDYERCIFIPTSLIDFRDERNIFKYLDILREAALDEDVRSALEELEDVKGNRLTFAINRIPSLAGLAPQVRIFVLAWSTHRLEQMRMLDHAGFIDLVPGASALNEMSLPFTLQLNNVRWPPIRNAAPRTLIDRVLIELEDGSVVSLTQSATESAPSNDINPALNGGDALSFGRIRAIRIVPYPNYAPSAQDAAIRFELAVKLDSQTAWLPCDFLMHRPVADYGSEPLLSITTPAGLPQLGALLMEQQLHYTQQIWLRENPQSMIMQFAPLVLRIEGRPVRLVDHINPVPIGILGNYIVYRFSYEEDRAWAKWVAANIDRSKRSIDEVAVPTGGVFAEAVLGRYNAAEKLDITRFFNWQDSPPPAPPAIAALAPGQQSPSAAPDLPRFDSPLVNIQTAVPLPDPSGFSAALTTLATQGLFRDMSGGGATGAIGTAGTTAASATSIQALTNAANAYARLVSMVSKTLQTVGSAEGLKTISDVGALLNEKRKAAGGDPQVPPSRPESPGGSAGGAGGPPDGRAKIVDDLLGQTMLASVAGKEDGQASDAPDPIFASAQGTPSDPILLNSELITDPTFADVTGFVFLLQTFDDETLLNVMIRRFDTVDTRARALAKYEELLQEIRGRSGDLENPTRMLFAAEWVKTGMIPQGLAESETARMSERALDIMVGSAISVARRTAGIGAFAVLKAIFEASMAAGIKDLNHAAYLLATAHHESRMGSMMTEIANGLSTDTIFTRDAYFFNFIPGKKSSYNGIVGNIKAGDRLAADGVIADQADIDAWNGAVYPEAQPAEVKLQARNCDFYRYIGRGLVQVTGRSNYVKFSNLAETGNIDFEAKPERATEPIPAAAILVNGMSLGKFRAGQSLSDFDDGDRFRGYDARDIVNGDKNKFPLDRDGNRIGDLTFGAIVRNLAIQYKEALLRASLIDETRPIV